jgi:hypothetical protein
MYMYVFTYIVCIYIYIYAYMYIYMYIIWLLQKIVATGMLVGPSFKIMLEIIDS